MSAESIQIIIVIIGLSLTEMNIHITLYTNIYANKTYGELVFPQRELILPHKIYLSHFTALFQDSSVNTFLGVIVKNR